MWAAPRAGPEQGCRGLGAAPSLSVAPFPSWMIAGHPVLYPETPGKFPSSVIHKEELQGAARFQGKRQLMNFHGMRRCRYRSKAVPQSVEECRRQSLHLLLPEAKLEKGALVSLTFSGRLSQWIKHGRPREAKAFELNLKNKQLSRPFIQLFNLQFLLSKSDMEEGKWVTEDIVHILISEYFTVEEKVISVGVFSWSKVLCLHKKESSNERKLWEYW